MIFTVPEKDETSYPIDLFVSFQFSHQWLFFCLFVLHLTVMSPKRKCILLIWGQPLFSNY